MSDATDPTPLPVPGFERLVWRPEVVTIPIEPRSNFMPQLVARGDDAGIVFAGRHTSNSEVSSLLLEGAFSSWPRARLRFLLKTIYCLHNASEPNGFTGTSDEGRFWDHDGSGGLTLITWNRDGLVAGGFDSDERAADDDYGMSAGNCFPDVPAILLPLVHDVLDTLRGQLTGGLWVTTGDDARFHKEGAFCDDFPRYTTTAQAALSSKRGGIPWGEDLAPWGPIAAPLAARAALGPHTVTPEEESALLAVPEGGAAVDPLRQRRAANAFAAAGVIWKEMAL